MRITKIFRCFVGLVVLMIAQVGLAESTTDAIDSTMSKAMGNAVYTVYMNRVAVEEVDEAGSPNQRSVILAIRDGLNEGKQMSNIGMPGGRDGTESYRAFARLNVVDLMIHSNLHRLLLAITGSAYGDGGLAFAVAFQQASEDDINFDPAGWLANALPLIPIATLSILNDWIVAAVEYGGADVTARYLAAAFELAGVYAEGGLLGGQ